MNDFGYKAIANMPTVLTRKHVSETEAGTKGWHESILRAYQILEKVKWLLEKNTDHQVVLELIALMESDEFQPYGWHQERYHEDSNHAGELPDCPVCRPSR